MKRLISIIMTLILSMALLTGSAVAVQAASATPAKVSVTGAKCISGTSKTAKVTVTWKKARNATAYRIYYKQYGSRAWKALANVSSARTSYTHTSSKKYPLTAGKKYVYTVRAYNKYSKKWGAYDTKGKAVTIPRPTVTPGTVKTCYLDAFTDDAVSIVWNTVSNATSYHIYYKAAKGSTGSGAPAKWTKIASVDAKNYGYIHESSSAYPLKAGHTYAYTIRAYNKNSKTWGSYNTNGWTVKMPGGPTPTPKPTQKPQPTATPMPTATPNPTATPIPTMSPEEVEAKAEKMAQEVIRLTNIERKKEGLSELQYHAKLQQAAMTRAKELSVKYSHARPDGRDSSTAVYEAGVGNSAGENIGVGFTTPKDVVQAWMDSNGHKVAILNEDATHIGVGYYCDESGTEYWVQDFSSGPDEKCTLTVDGNGGTFPSKGNVEKFELQVPKGMTLYTEDFEEPVRAGYVFEKWTSAYPDGYENKKTTIIHMSENQTLKANWLDASESTQSLFSDPMNSEVNNRTPFNTDNLFSDGAINQTFNENASVNTTTETSTPTTGKATERTTNAGYDNNTEVEFANDEP